MSKESALARWLKDWTPVEGERFKSLMEGHKRTLTIDPLRRSDAGEYTCDVNTDQIHFSLLVKGSFSLFLDSFTCDLTQMISGQVCRDRNEGQVHQATPGYVGPR